MVAFLRRTWIAGELYFSVSNLHMFCSILAVSGSSGPGERRSSLISSSTGLTEDTVTDFSREDACEVSQWFHCCIDGLQHRNILPGWVGWPCSVLNQDTSYGWELLQHPLYHLLLFYFLCYFYMPVHTERLQSQFDYTGYSTGLQAIIK